MKLIRKIFVTLFFVLLSEFGFGQQFSISGKILDQSNQPISYANILLLKEQDSTFVTGTVSDDLGKFTILEINSGNYILKISFIGFEEFEQNISAENNIEFNTIVLKESAETLGEITLTYKKPTLKKEADRLVFNIENTALSEGNIMEVLRRTPTVLVMDNTILVKNSVPTVFINDRKVHLSATEIVELLEGTSASNIKSIEVITNPSARYDAESGVVLNIVMSKNLITGYSGSIFSNYTQGVFPKQNYGVSNFFKNKKISFFANYSYNNKKIDRVNKEWVDYSSEIWSSDIDRNKWTETHNLNTNFDYLINKKNRLSFSTNMQFSPYFIYTTRNITDITNSENILLSKFNANSRSRDKKNNIGLDLDYVHWFKNNNGKLSFNTHFTNYNYKTNQNVNSDYFSADNTFLQTTAFNTASNQETQIFTVQLDYSVDITKDSRLELGVKTSQIETKSSIIQNDIVNNQEMLNGNNSDAFNYKEDILAAYVSYSTNWDKWDLSTGLRLEQTKIRGKQVLNNETNTQDYLQWFPTANISFQASDKTSIYANYKRSIQRPSYINLNPFKFFFNDNTFITGNPDLQPVFVNYITIGTSISNTYTFEVYYKVNNGNIFELPIQDNINNTVAYTPTNIKSSKELGFDFLAYFNVTERWFLSFVTSFYKIKDEAIFNNEIVNFNKWSNYTVINNSFSFLKDRSLKTSFIITYVSANLQGLREVATRVLTELSLSKTIFKSKGVVSLSFSDLLNDHDYFVTTKYLNQNSTSFTNLDNRYIKFGFRYKFGNTKLKTNERSKEKEELNRLKKSVH